MEETGSIQELVAEEQQKASQGFVAKKEEQFLRRDRQRGVSFVNRCNGWDVFLVWTGPLACLSPFSVVPWIRSDKCPNLRSSIPMFLMSRIKVPNKSLSDLLNENNKHFSVLHYYCSLTFSRGLVKNSLLLEHLSYSSFSLVKAQSLRLCTNIMQLLSYVLYFSAGLIQKSCTCLVLLPLLFIKKSGKFLQCWLYKQFFH